MAGDIPVKNGERTSAVKAMADARDRVGKQVSVMIFREGTRSRDVELLPYEDGAFRLALKVGVPIIPLVVAGTRDAMAKGVVPISAGAGEDAVADRDGGAYRDRCGGAARSNARRDRRGEPGPLTGALARKSPVPPERGT